jgi:hypothetical protein
MKDKQERDFEAYLDSVEIREFFERARTELFPKVEASSLFISLFTGGHDAKFCLELGVAIMLGKPILLLALKGAPIPPRLRAIADRVVVAESVESASEELRAAMHSMMLES